MTNVVVRSKMFKLASEAEQKTIAKKSIKAASDNLPKVLYEPVRHYLEYSQPTNEVGDVKRIDFPLNIDTEFVSRPVHWSQPFEFRDGQWIDRLCRQSTRQHISTQMRGIGQDSGVIFSSRECSHLIPRHKALSTGFDPIDYLVHLGYAAELKRIDLSKFDRNLKQQFSKLPEFRVVLFAHFATAELMLITRDQYWDDFEALVATPDPKNPPGKPRFSLKRHLKAITETINSKGNLIVDSSVELPWVLTLGDRQFKITVEWVDTCALHGQGSYKAICESARVPIPFKDTFTSAEKGRMLEMAVDRAEEFDNYSLGDLFVFDALVGNAENFRKVYQALGIEHLFKEPALTIGATVKNLFEAKLSQELGVNYQVRDEMNYLRSNFLSPVSAKVLKQNPGMTRCLAAKVEGGRCRNNRPTDWKIDKPLCDIDVSGCYAEGLRYQPYPIGNPEILDFEASNRSSYWTLGQFRKTYGAELVKGLWVARVWSESKLDYGQDFLASWFLPSVGDDLLSMGKYVQQMSTDTEQQSHDEQVEFELDDGQLKIFTHEIINGVITHDFLDWLDHVATPRQRKELEAKLLIKVAIVYPKSWEIKGDDNVERYRTLVADSQKHEDRDKVERVSAKGRKKLRREDGQYHGWFSVNIGELIIDDLLTWRKHYQKTEGKKKPMDLVFKLCCNTLYGDMTSKYFDAANIIVGNNVTARARAMVWYAEKGLHGIQSITDGGAFELNRVVYPIGKNRRVSGENVVDLYVCDDREARLQRQLKFAPLGGCDRIDLTWDDYSIWDNKKNEVTSVCLPTLNLIKGEETTVLTPVLEPNYDHDCENLKSIPSHSWIDRTALEHIQALFPNVSVLHSPSKRLDAVIGEDGMPIKVYSDRLGLFSFEMKGFFDSGVFHGSANYLIESPAGDVLKMRSYETSKPHESLAAAYAVDLENKEAVISPYVSDRYGAENNPGNDFMKGLMTGMPLARQVTFVKEGILKPSDYKERRAKYRGLGLVPGDGFFKPGLLREFSLSQFTFPTMQQFVEWEKRVTRMKDKFGQSLERYFIGRDGKIDFNSMVKEIDRLIKEGVENPIEALDPRYNQSRLDKIEHPELGTFLSVKSLLGLSNAE